VPPSILILDDEPLVGSSLRRFLERDSFEAESFERPAQALERLKQQPFDLFLTDLNLPEFDGIEVLQRVKKIRPHCEVVIMTGYATVETAIEAIKRGAVDYLTKPFSYRERLLPLLHSILEADATESWPEERRRADATARPVRPAADPLDFLVTRSPGMQRIATTLPRIARSGGNVLLRGESGTGKEGIADAIHALSERADKPLVKVNCAAIPESLLESEFFGHKKGAFTGAHRDRDGLFQSAHTGTLFLDEVGDLPLGIQAKLLRVLQSGEVQQLGDAGKVGRVDFRLIAATNRNLEAAIAQGAFREDLYYRLAVLPVELPPLRERLEDLDGLIRVLSARIGPGEAARMSDPVLGALHTYPWPGNVRELENAVEHALVLADGDEVRLEHLPAAIQDHVASTSSSLPVPPQVAGTLEDIEVSCILQAMQKTGFNQTHAARVLGITRRTLAYRIGKYGLRGQLESLRQGNGPPRMARIRPVPRSSSASI